MWLTDYRGYETLDDDDSLPLGYVLQSLLQAGLIHDDKIARLMLCNALGITIKQFQQKRPLDQ